jgi:hypothetical protein
MNAFYSLIDRMINDNLKLMRAYPKQLFLLGIHIFLTAVIFWSSRGAATISWMYVFSYEDIKTWPDLWTFLIELRTGICPYIAFTEIIWSWVFGDLELYTRWIYFILAITAFTLPVIVAMKIGFRTQIVTFLICLIFCIGIAQTHQCNPQIYDLLYPVLVFCVILLLENSNNWVNAFLAGLALGLLELTRPFVLMMLPLFLLVAYFKLHGRRKFLIFLIPLILTSGLWHAKLLFLHRQIVWTNCTGFNLATVWLENPPISEFSEEPPRKEYLWPNLNTELHQQNSQKLKQMVFSSWVQDPIRFLKIFVIRIYQGGGNIISLYQCSPKHWSLPFYNLVATTIYILSFVAIGFWISDAVYYLKRLKLLLNPIFLIMFVGCLTAVFNAIGQRFEEARLIVSCLPAFALLPSLCVESFKLRQNAEFIQ